VIARKLKPLQESLGNSSDVNASMGDERYSVDEHIKDSVVTAAKEGNAESMQCIILQGADVNAINNDKPCGFHAAYAQISRCYCE